MRTIPTPLAIRIVIVIVRRIDRAVSDHVAQRIFKRLYTIIYNIILCDLESRSKYSYIMCVCVQRVYDGPWCDLNVWLKKKITDPTTHQGHPVPQICVSRRSLAFSIIRSIHSEPIVTVFHDVYCDFPGKFLATRAPPPTHELW